MSNESLKHQIFLNVAQELSKLSHCVSHKVAAVIVKDGRILSTGINGTPKGFKNCDEVFPEKGFNRAEHHKFSEDFEIHAELNAILFAAKNDISIDGADMYINLQPCKNCLKAICNSGIKNIWFSEKYDLVDYDDSINNMLKAAGIVLHACSCNDASQRE